MSSIQQFGVGEVVLCVISTPSGDLQATFFDFLKYWKDIEIFIDLARFPETPESEGTTKVGGKNVVPAWQQTTNLMTFWL